MSTSTKPVRKRRFKRTRKVLLWLFSVVIAGMMLLIFFSPYGSHEGFSYKLIRESVVVDVPVDSAFRFLGNSDNARRWSVYVDHITTLNSIRTPDGTPGSIRRCFCNKDEKGQRWDELITLVEPNKRRQLTTYNLVDFPMQANGLASEQRYRKIAENRCEITFTLFFANHDPGFWDELKTYFGAYKVQSIFRQNLDNIKRILETGK
ncbi:MAG TPA: SRPBCC family protein [Fluviicola sp.]|nr:SRPBCC family protein [Fluviicola sp.]